MNTKLYRINVLLQVNTESVKNPMHDDPVAYWCCSLSEPGKDEDMSSRDRSG